MGWFLRIFAISARHPRFDTQQLLRWRNINHFHRSVLHMSRVIGSPTAVFASSAFFLEISSNQ